MRDTMSVVVYACDVVRVAGFYAAVLDVAVERPDPSYAVLDGGGWQLVIHAIPAAYAEGIAIADPPQVRDETPIKAVLPVADLAPARAAAARHGGRLHDEDREWTFRGSIRCDGVDPEGNVFQLTQPQPPRTTTAGTLNLRG